jgi:hypothetical protein
MIPEKAAFFLPRFSKPQKSKPSAIDERLRQSFLYKRRLAPFHEGRNRYPNTAKFQRLAHARLCCSFTRHHSDGLSFAIDQPDLFRAMFQIENRFAL